jgi:hypothetical protein
MGTKLAAGLGPLFALALVIAVFAPASSAASGQERFSGLIVTSGRSGDRQVLATTVIARGVFNGVGRLVEIASLPGDPDNVLRDDLVFAQGTLHLVSTTNDGSFDVDPKSCRFDATAVQTGEITGGTGIFANATGESDATVHARGILARNPDGSCSFDRAPIAEVDTIESNGTFSY